MKQSILLILATLLLQGNIQAQTPALVKKLQVLPRDLEIELALSALPPHLRDSATVYVLNPAQGFEVARKGSNGFHAFVARTGDDAMSGTWILKAYRDDVLYPISFDKEGAEVQMKVFFDIATLQAKGMPPEDLKKLIQHRYKTGYYKAPERPGVSYMLSPILRTYTNPDQNDSVFNLNFPHIMYYAPNMSSADVGGSNPKPEDLKFILERGRWPQSPYPFIIHKGPHGYMITARGDEERMAINKEYAAMLSRLCAIRKEWCLQDSQTPSMDHGH